MPFKEKAFPYYFLFLLAVGFLSLWQTSYSEKLDYSRASYTNKYDKHQEGSSSLASTSENLETVSSCGSDRNYLLKGINALPAIYRQTRIQENAGQIPRACVSYIMQHFIDAKNVKSGSYGHCESSSGQPNRGADGMGSYLPCVTESYVNSVYNSLADVSDCLNIPIRELMPKLANESGLHINTLGPDADGGVGQLTRSALSEVYMRYEDIPGQDSNLNYYIKEMSKSNKPSCSRIIAQKSAYTIAVPAGKRLCMIHETDENCFKPWMVQSRCEFMSAPESPLRNVLFTGIYYRSMYKNATGVNYRAGDDVIWSNGGSVVLNRDMSYSGFIGKKSIAERFENLGIKNPSETVIRQILVSFGFNGGIGTGQTLLDNYLKLREQKALMLKPEDLDFLNVSIASWSLVSNPKSFLNMLAEPNPELFQQALSKLDAVKIVSLDVNKYTDKVLRLRKTVREAMTKVEAAGVEADIKSTKVGFINQSEEIRREILNDVFDRSDKLSLPEFMRIGHAWTIAFKKGGGAPGYLSFLAGKHKELEKEMGAGLCTAEQYLQF